MNIGFLIPSMYRGGAERTMSILCNEFARRGYGVTLFLTENETGITFILNNRISVVNINSSGKSYASKMCGYIMKIKHESKERKIDVIISFITRTNMSAIIACKQLGIPVIVSERNNPYVIPDNKKLRLIRDIIYRYADGIVFQTTYAKEYYCKKVQDKSKIIMNPMMEAIDKSVLFENKDNIIISACRLSPQKNIPLLISAFEKIHKDIPNFQLHIYGDGPEREQLITMIQKKKLDNKVFLMGVSENVIKMVARAKVFVLSSDFEGLSNALMEALCVGTACVATDSPAYGNRDLIKDGQNGFLVPVGDVNAMADKILLLSQNEGLNKSFSERAMMLCNETNYVKIADSWENYIRTVVK